MTRPTAVWRFWRSTPSVRTLLLATLLSLLPGIAALMWLDGMDLLPGIGIAVVVALLTEGLLLRASPPVASVSWLSALVTAVLLALLLPAELPWWITGLGVVAALAVARHAFGGLGENVFNPAMLGLALLVLLFPAPFSGLGPTSLVPLAVFAVAGVALAAVCVNGWQAPLAMLGGAAAGFAFPGAADVAWQAQLATLPVVLGAFFVVTDPVSGCLSGRGRAAFGLGVGLLLALYDRIGSVPMALPFAVLTMNCLAPWLDRHTGPRRSATVATS